MNKQRLLEKVDFRGLYHSYLGSSLRDKGKSQAMALCPFHEEQTPSLSIDLENGLFNCFACGEKGDVFTFVMKREDVDFPTAMKLIAEKQRIPMVDGVGSPSAIYPYHDENGAVIARKLRFEPGKHGAKKDFHWEHLKNGRWVSGRGTGALIFNRHKLKDHPSEQLLIWCEGEKNCALFENLGFSAVSLDSGANSKWNPLFNQLVKSIKTHVIFADNDVPGVNYSHSIAEALHVEGHLVKLPEYNQALPPGGDIEQWIEQRKSKSNDEQRQDLLDLIEDAPPWSPSKELIAGLKTWEDIRALDIQVEWVVDKLIPKQSITILFGKGGSGKTWLALTLASCIGKGENFLSLKTKSMPVICVDFENPVPVLSERTKLLGQCLGMVKFWLGNDDKIKPPRLDSEEWVLYKKLPPESILIFDTLRASHTKDENSSEFMSQIMGRLKELRDLGFTIILLHHTPKSSESVSKGSSAIVDLADHVLGLTKVRKKGDEVEEIDDEEEEGIYQFGVKGKSRYEPYYLFLVRKAEGGFDLAPDPRSESLTKMESALRTKLEREGKSYLKKTEFQALCQSDLGISKNKFGGLLNMGKGILWKIEPGAEKNAILISPIQFSSSPANIGGGKQENTIQESQALSQENLLKLFE